MKKDKEKRNFEEIGIAMGLLHMKEDALNECNTKFLVYH